MWLQSLVNHKYFSFQWFSLCWNSWKIALRGCQGAIRSYQIFAISHCRISCCYIKRYRWNIWSFCKNRNVYGFFTESFKSWTYVGLHHPSHWEYNQKNLPPTKWSVKKVPSAQAAGADPSWFNSTNLAKIHLFSKTAVTFKPKMPFWCPLGFRIS